MQSRHVRGPKTQAAHPALHPTRWLHFASRSSHFHASVRPNHSVFVPITCTNVHLSLRTDSQHPKTTLHHMNFVATLNLNLASLRVRSQEHIVCMRASVSAQNVELSLPRAELSERNGSDVTARPYSLNQHAYSLDIAPGQVCLMQEHYLCTTDIPASTAHIHHLCALMVLYPIKKASESLLQCSASAAGAVRRDVRRLSHRVWAVVGRTGPLLCSSPTLSGSTSR